MQVQVVESPSPTDTQLSRINCKSFKNASKKLTHFLMVPISIGLATSYL